MAGIRDGRSWVVVGLDNGGTSNNATILDEAGTFLVDQLVESPSMVLDGPEAAVEALAGSMQKVLDVAGVARTSVRAVGLGTPGPASAVGVLSSRGATNFSQPAWWGFDYRGALEARLELPVVYINDGNAAALYAHHVHFGSEVHTRSSVAVVVGTGLGGGLVEAGRVVSGAAGMAGELGHIQISMDGLLEDGQPIPMCNCGLGGDVESIASLTGIAKNLLPYWLSVYPAHELSRSRSLSEAAKLVRGYGESGDALARKIFEQQAIALARAFTLVSNVFDPAAYFVGGGVVETSPEFRAWFLTTVRQHTSLREEQERSSVFDIVPSLDMAGARGAALAARESLRQR